ncbi:MAG: hypothetical protein A3F46_09515 [Legionellales bacterium RIFCSPHIGHO2_12_FULL_42_9]|nr:MAG: hypothetical protein A3F46_09515 [Legionellales bacterium RIFCSPHIGHO2_12_FULL_42_9]
MNPLSLGSLLLALGVAIIWGINFVMVKISLEQIPPLTLCSLRFLFASIPAIFFIRRPNLPWKTIIQYGSLTFALQFSLLFAGMAAGVSPGVAALISQSQVFFSMFLAWILTQQKIGIWQILGAIVAFAGIGVIGLHKNIDCTLIGFLLLLGAAMFWSIGNCIAINLKNVNMFALVVWGSFIAFFPLSFTAWIVEHPLKIIIHPELLAWTTILAVAYITYASTHFGYASWSWLLNKYPTASIVPFALFSPIAAMIASTLLFHESFELWKGVATLLVTTGLCVNLFGQSLYLRLKNYRS